MTDGIGMQRQSAGPVWEAGEKTHGDENFPVASRLIAKRHRGVILSFYRFARAADDVADDPALSEAAKIGTLDRFEDTLLGHSDAIPVAVPLRDAILDRNLSACHGQDLLAAFRLDASKTRYETWDDLMGYCRLSAMPVGRFVLDVHGESRGTWEPSDALCAALQVINHLQDCGADYRRLDRVYLPLDVLERHGASIDSLAAAKASPALRACIEELAAGSAALLQRAVLSDAVQDLRLSLEVAAIQRLARNLVRRLSVLDPLSERVHLSKTEGAGTLASAVTLTLARRLFSRKRPPQTI